MNKLRVTKGIILREKSKSSLMFAFNSVVIVIVTMEQFSELDYNK